MEGQTLLSPEMRKLIMFSMTSLIQNGVQITPEIIHEAIKTVTGVEVPIEMIKMIFNGTNMTSDNSLETVDHILGCFSEGGGISFVMKMLGNFSTPADTTSKTVSAIDAFINKVSSTPAETTSTVDTFVAEDATRLIILKVLLLKLIKINNNDKFNNIILSITSVLYKRTTHTVELSTEEQVILQQQVDMLLETTGLENEKLIKEYNRLLG